MTAPPGDDAVGAMRARVTLQRPTRVADELGGAAIVWSDEGEVWAAVDAVGVGERASFDTAASVASYRLAIRRRDGVRAGWRVLWGSRLLRIAGVRDLGGARIELFCEEESR